MPSKRRLGVALILDPPLAAEVDGLRRALGDPGLTRIPAHLTLVPPVNVRSADLSSALSRLREAAATLSGPMRLTLGPVTTFAPANPVLYLAVGGDLERLRILRDAVFAPPLERSLSWPWVPHVTIADGIEDERVAAGVAALGRYAAVADIDRVVLLEEQAARVWQPVADARIGPRARVGTGGLMLELSEGRILDPEAALILDPAVLDRSAPEGHLPGLPPVVITGRRDGEVVGTAAAWAAADGGHVAVFVRPDCRGQGIGSHLLAHVEAALRREGWRYPALIASGPPSFYAARSGWSVAYSKATEAY